MELVSLTGVSDHAGVIISDCDDIPALVSFRVAANLSQAAARGIDGGVDLDLQCGLNKSHTAYTWLEQVSEKREKKSTFHRTLLPRRSPHSTARSFQLLKSSEQPRHGCSSRPSARG